MDKRQRRSRSRNTISRHTVLLIAITSLALTAHAASARQLPERYEYHPREALRPPSGPSAQLAIQIKKVIGKNAVLDRTLTEAAERLTRNRNLTARDAMRASGASDAFALPIRYRVRQEPTISPVMHVLKTEVRNAHVSHFGVAVRAENDAIHIALLFVRRGAWLGRLPTHFELGQRYVVDGRLTEGLINPRLLVATPNAGVMELQPRTAHGVFWTHISFNSGPGRYIIEVQANDRFGTQVLNLMEVYASKPGAPRQVPIVRLRPPESLPATPEVAASRAVRLVNRSRKVHHLPPLRLSNALTDAATSHAEDMATEGYFGHESPSRGGLAERLRRANIRMSLALENIAIGLSPDTVHADLLRSPSHLRNILDPSVTHIGIGAYRRTIGESRPIFTFSQIFGRY